MRKVSLILAYTTPIEVAKGVWEDELKEKKVRADQVKVYQSRQDQAKLNGLAINGRFEIRDSFASQKLDYVRYKGNKYKVYSSIADPDMRKIIIELGEML